MVAALTRHHGREGRSVSNATPARLDEIARLASNPGKGVTISRSTVSRFFRKHFPDHGYEEYVIACRDGTIGLRLSVWEGELPGSLHAALRPSDTEPGDPE